MELGGIVIFKNIVFRNRNISKTHEIDHSFYSGRPCIYIGEYDDNMYFLPITSPDLRREQKSFDVMIRQRDHSRLSKDCKVNFVNIIKKPIAFYNQIDFLNESEINEMIDKGLILYEFDSEEYYDVLFKLFSEYAKKNKIDTVNYKIKKRKMLNNGKRKDWK